MNAAGTDSSVRPRSRRTLYVAGGLAAIALATLVGFAWLHAQNQESDEAPVHAIEVVAEYPHDRRAYCQGLVYDEGVLYESTGHYGESTIRRVDLETGRPTKVTPLGRQHFGEGLALWDGQLIQLTWKARLALVYDKETLVRKSTFRYTGEGWGLTHDGKQLVMSDGTATLRFLDPQTFAVVRRVQVVDGDRPVDKLNELEFVRGELLANVWYSDFIARIDPASGRVLGWIDCSGLHPASRRGNRDDVLNGIAWDAAKDRLFVTGKNWPKLFQIRVQP